MKKSLLMFSLVFPISFHGQNVGIGTSSPGAKLEVRNPTMSTVKISSAHYNDSSQVVFSNRSVSNLGTDFIFTSAREQGLFLTTSSDIPQQVRDSLISFVTNGNVGIGVKAPHTRLVVHDPAVGSSHISITNLTTGSGSGNGLSIGMFGTNAQINNYELGSLSLGTGNIFHLTILSNGNVGFQKSNPSAAVDVEGSIVASGNITSGFNISLSNELNRTSTGSTNLLPIAWGFVEDDGDIFASSTSGNFTVSHPIAGEYRISITGESYHYQSYSAIATAIDGSIGVGARVVTTGSLSSMLIINIYNLSGTLVDAPFNFVVYKK